MIVTRDLTESLGRKHGKDPERRAVQLLNVLEVLAQARNTIDNPIEDLPRKTTSVNGS